MRGFFYCFFPTGSPVNGSIYSFIFILSAIISSVILFFIYSSIFFVFSLLYLQNILCTKNACSHTYTSNLHVCRISLVNFSLAVSYYLRHAVFWRYFYQHMYMVYAAFCFYYFYFFSFAEHS